MTHSSKSEKRGFETGNPRADAAAKPQAREPETEGMPDEKPGITGPHPGNDSRQAPANPRTAGAPDRSGDPLRDPFANRRNDARQEDGATPRPEENPVE